MARGRAGLCGAPSHERSGKPATFTQPARLAGGIDRIRRRTYIYCNDPTAIAFTPFHERFKNKPGWTVGTLPCMHFAQMDMRNELLPAAA